MKVLMCAKTTLHTSTVSFTLMNAASTDSLSPCILAPCNVKPRIFRIPCTHTNTFAHPSERSQHVVPFSLHLVAVQGSRLEVGGQAGGQLVTHALGLAEDLQHTHEARGKLITHALGLADLQHMHTHTHIHTRHVVSWSHMLLVLQKICSTHTQGTW